MKIMIQPIAIILGFVGASVVDAETEQSEPEPPKITHENLYQMEELVEQGADPNAPYWLYPGVP